MSIEIYRDGMSVDGIRREETPCSGQDCDRDILSSVNFA